MSDYLNWEKISQEYYKQKLLQKEKFLEAINVNQINNIKDFDQKYLGVLQQSQNSSQTLKEFLGLQGFIKKNLNKYLVNPPDPPTANCLTNEGDNIMLNSDILKSHKSTSYNKIFNWEGSILARFLSIGRKKVLAGATNILSTAHTQYPQYQFRGIKNLSKLWQLLI